MKTIFKVFGYLLGLGFAILLSLHLFLQFGLTQTMRKVVLPCIQEETGIDVRVGHLSLNLPNGILSLNGVEVRNPAGFFLENLASVERVEVEVDILSLFKQNPVLVRNIEVENALLNVIRNKDGDINIAMLQQAPAEPVPESGIPTQRPEDVPDSGQPASQPVELKPLPEVLLEALVCNAQIRYLDFRLDQLDLMLDLRLVGHGLSSQSKGAWGDLAVTGSLGDDRTRFITDLKILLAPLTDPVAPSFDLTGKVMEIDPRIMDKAYSKMGIRSAPFGLAPELHCREGFFENSAIALNLKKVELEDKLSKRLGGMGTIGALRLVVPVEGSLQQPVVDIQGSLMSAIGGNVNSVLDAFLKGAVAKETGSDTPPESLSDAAVELLGAHVDEIGESETVKKVLKDLADGEPSATNAPAPINTDTLIDILGEHVDEIGEDEELKEDLKQLGNWLFGK